MANLREIKRRIGAVKNTKKITSAMKMVAGAKLRKATDAATAARPYKNALAKVLNTVADTVGDESGQELLTAHDKIEKVLIIVFGTDRGLCGSFNTGLFRETSKWAEEQEKNGRTVEIWAIGKKAAPYFKSRGSNVTWSKMNIKNDEYMDAVREIGERLQSTFVSGEVQEVFLGFNTFKNVLLQPTTFTKLLPMTVETSEVQPVGQELTMIDYKYEPDAETILDTLVPLYMQTIIHQSFLETEAGEHASRMTSMDNATRNASDIIENLTLLYNRARQAAITTELIEIVAGAEAL